MAIVRECLNLLNGYLKGKKIVEGKNKVLKKELSQTIKEFNKDKIAKDKLGEEKKETLTETKTRLDLCAQNRKKLEEKKEKLMALLKNGLVIGVIAGALTAAAANYKTPEYKKSIVNSDGNTVVISGDKDPGQSNKDVNQPTAKGITNNGGQKKNTKDIQDTSILNEKGANYVETKTTTGKTKDEVSLEGDTLKEEKKITQEAIKKAKEEGKTVTEHKDKITTVKEEKKEEIKKNEEKNVIDHSYGEAEEEKGQVVEKIQSEESKKAANKITDQVKEETPAPEKAPEKTDTYKEATDAELDALEDLFR